MDKCLCLYTFIICLCVDIHPLDNLSHDLFEDGTTDPEPKWRETATTSLIRRYFDAIPLLSFFHRMNDTCTLSTNISRLDSRAINRRIFDAITREHNSERINWKRPIILCNYNRRKSKYCETSLSVRRPIDRSNNDLVRVWCQRLIRRLVTHRRGQIVKLE